MRKIIQEFLLEHSTDIILFRLNISKYKLLKILALLRLVMAKDIPTAVKPLANQNRVIKPDLSKNALSNFIFGLIQKEDKIWVETIPLSEAVKTGLIVDARAKKKPIIPPELWQNYTGLIINNRINRRPETGNKKTLKKSNYNISGLEGFWGYLKRKLAFKGGIRQEKLPLYIGEHTWKYNNRNLSLADQEKHLFKLITNHLKGK
ncbi:unnamed protein product [marine sediment metagenome]|uniref:ISXO2-like transposase domain-containing protein n=1 Tax=marine sediment metagenome TaxID=412755 RepID=X0SFZ5_9ZZZZ